MFPAFTNLALLGGLAAATLLTRFLEGQLYGVEPLDPVALIGAVGVLGLVAAGSEVVPFDPVPPVRRAITLLAETMEDATTAA